VSIASGELEKSAIFPYQYRNFNDLQRCPDRISGLTRSCSTGAVKAARTVKKMKKILPGRMGRKKFLLLTRAAIPLIDYRNPELGIFSKLLVSA
jgi:hypothetical protein